MKINIFIQLWKITTNIYQIDRYKKQKSQTLQNALGMPTNKDLKKHNHHERHDKE